MISKELLMEVTGRTSLEYDGYNIYELTNECKDWIYEHGYGIAISLEHPAYTITCNVLFAGQTRHTIADAEDEPTAVFMAAEWIIEQSK